MIPELFLHPDNPNTSTPQHLNTFSLHPVFPDSTLPFLSFFGFEVSHLRRLSPVVVRGVNVFRC